MTQPPPLAELDNSYHVCSMPPLNGPMVPVASTSGTVGATGKVSLAAC